jgi:hypothetical protein
MTSSAGRVVIHHTEKGDHPRMQRTRIADLERDGLELDEEQLRLAAGGLARRTTISTLNWVNGQLIYDACPD